MDIAALSVLMQHSNLQQSTSMSVLKMAMDTAEGRGEAMTDMLKQTVPAAPHPTLGNKIDLKG